MFSPHSTGTKLESWVAVVGPPPPLVSKENVRPSLDHTSPLWSHEKPLDVTLTWSKLRSLFGLNTKIEGVRLKNMQCPSSSNMKIYLPWRTPAENKALWSGLINHWFPSKKGRLLDPYFRESTWGEGGVYRLTSHNCSQGLIPPRIAVWGLQHTVNVV